MLIRVSKLFVEVIVTVVVLAAAGLAVLAWRLSEGPIPLSWLAPYIERALSDEETGTRVEFEETVLAWSGWEHNLDIRALNVTIASGDGAMAAHIPELELSFSTRALLRGMLAPVAIALHRPRLTIIRTEEGSLRFGADDKAVAVAGDNNDAGQFIPLMIAESLREPDFGRASAYLRRISIVDGITTIYDLTSGKTWSIPDTDATLFRNPSGLRADLGITVKIDDSEARLAATVSYAAGGDHVEGQIRFRDVALANLSVIDSRLARLAILQTKASGIVDLAMAPTGQIRTIGFNLTGVAGRIVAPEMFPEPVAFQQMRLLGSFPDGARQLRIDKAALDLGATKIEISGDIVDLDARPRLSLIADVRNVAVDDFGRLWPTKLGANPRRWITANLSKGVVHEGRFEIAAAAVGGDDPAITLEAAKGSFRFSGLAVQYLKPLPPVINVAGSGRVAMDRVDLEATSGELGNLKVESAKIAMTDFDRNVELANINVAVRGPLREALELVDRPPLGFVKAIGQLPEDYSGDAAIRILFKFPLLDRLKVEEIDMAVTANVAAFAQRNVVLGLDARDGTLALRLNNKGMDIRGQVTIGAAIAEIEVARNFLAEGQVVGETKVRGTLSSDDRAALGFDLRPTVDGPVDVALVYTERRGRRSQLAADLKLNAANVMIREQNWSKPPGVPATARFELRLENGKPVDVPVLRASGEGLQIIGRAVFSRDGNSLARVDVDSLKVGLTDVRGSFARLPEGIEINVAGRSFDAGPLLNMDDSGGGKSAGDGKRPELRVAARVDRLYLAPDRDFDQLSVDGVRSWRRWERIDLKALTPNAGGAGNPASIDLTTDAGGHQTLLAKAADAGALLRVVDATPNVVGGTIEIKGATDAKIEGAPLVGSVGISEFRLVKAPALARVLSVALLTGILDSLRGEGIGFSRLDGDFEAYDTKIKIRDARAYGPALGITAKGILDTENESLDISGTLVPAYALNSVFGSIPLLGRILVPEKGGGFFAADYKISGPLADPTVTVNPLSTIAPGFLRGLFNLFEDGKPPPDFRNDPSFRRDGQ